MSKINLTIDGTRVVVQEGSTILNAAKKANITIPTLCNSNLVKVYGACGMCVVEIEGQAKLFRACSTQARDGMSVYTATERIKNTRKVVLELMMSEHNGDCKGPCKLNCPAETECQQYAKLIAKGEYKKAVEVIKQKLPLPASIGRVCPHPCEDACRRKNVEQSVSLASLKYFAADFDLANDPYIPEIAPSSGKKVAIIGGGPSGLSAAYFLAIKGHSVTVYESMPEAGGMLRYGIPAYRLPKNVLASEIAIIENLGVKILTNVKIGRDIRFQDVKNQYDAVLVSIGAWKSSAMNIPGEDLPGVIGGIDFLRETATQKRVSVGESVAISGGGNTAMDACRTAVRLGAKHVYVLYRRTRDEMPASSEEIEEAVEEGVEFKFLSNPIAISPQNGKLCVTVQKMRLGEPDEGGRRSPVAIEGETERLILDEVIMAIGQSADTTGFEELQKNKRGNIVCDEETFTTETPGVFASGDITNRGAGIAIAAISEGGKAACSIDKYLKGEDISFKKPYYSVRNVAPETYKNEKTVPRVKMHKISAQERKDNFREIACGFTEEEAKAEASRCLECGCHDYGECKLIAYTNEYSCEPGRFAGRKNHHETTAKIPIIERNPDKCILCGLCVRICSEDANMGLLGIMGRGFDSFVAAEFADPDISNACLSCRKCVEACPTGSLKLLLDK